MRLDVASFEGCIGCMACLACLSFGGARMAVASLEGLWERKCTRWRFSGSSFRSHTSGLGGRDRVQLTIAESAISTPFTSGSGSQGCHLRQLILLTTFMNSGPRSFNVSR